VNPAFASFTDVVVLNGFSGADVAVLNSHARPFVRKAASTPSANPMLQRQAERQSWLAGVLVEGAQSPSVIDQGMVEGCFYFDMTFVPGRDAVTYLGSADFEAVDQFAGRVEALVEQLAAHPPAPTRELLLAKAREIDQRTGQAFSPLLDLLVEVASDLPSAVFDRPATATHGDLTFENVLVDRRGGLWLIDAIDGPFAHYWLDLAKLFQECEGHWHAHRKRPIAVSVTHHLRRRWTALAARLDPSYPLVHYVLLALTFARILPYARSPEDVHFLQSRVEGFTARARAALKEFAE
jgi:aminoglycoside phosphotransferase